MLHLYVEWSFFKLLFISTNLDPLQFDEGLANRIQANSRRYVDLFSDAVDATLPQPSIPIEALDVTDVLLQHRQKLVDQNNSDVPRDPENSFPKQLLRRLYALSFHLF